MKIKDNYYEDILKMEKIYRLIERIMIVKENNHALQFYYYKK